MLIRRFEHAFSQERKAALLVALIQILLIITAICLAVLSWNEYRWITLFVAMLSLALFLLFSFYLVYQFRSMLSYRKRLQIEAKTKEVEKNAYLTLIKEDGEWRVVSYILQGVPQDWREIGLTGMD